MKIQNNISLKPFNSFGVDVSARYLTVVNKTQQLISFLSWVESQKKPYILIGGGSNILFTKNYHGLAVIIQTKGKKQVGETQDDYFIEAKAGENWHDFVCWSIQQGYSGLENLSLIPGTVGAAPMQNIGAYGVELADRFHSLKAIHIPTGKPLTFDKTACDFAYRHSFFKANIDQYIIESVIFQLPKKPEWKINYAGVKEALTGKVLSAELISRTIIDIRRSKLPDPTDIGNAGSFFKNPIITAADILKLQEKYPTLPAYPQTNTLVKTSAAWLIDQCGWKGKCIGQAAVYPKHALVLSNLGNATGEEIWHLAQEIIRSVNDKFGITLEPEPRVIY